MIVETCAEAFGVADAALELGHEARVVPASLVRTLGVGARRTKTDQRDAQVLSEVSCRIDLPSVHIPSVVSRGRKTQCGMREALVGTRTKLINTVRGWLRAQGVHLRTGRSSTFSQRVRAVRGNGLPAHAVRQLTAIDGLIAAYDAEFHYVVSADGLTVTDTSTGLVWQRDGSGSRPSCAINPLCTWAEAQAYCAGLTLDGSGWRLPSLTELQSIVDTTVTSPPRINYDAFPNTPVDWFWASWNAGSSGNMWGVNFGNGLSDFNGVGLDHRVRCVR